MVDRLDLKDLVVRAGDQELVRSVSLTLFSGRITALVGASGSGKTMTARACLGLVRPSPGVVSGSLRVQVGTEDHQPYDQAPGPAREAAFAQVRGRLVGYLPQDARAALDPLWTVRRQVAEVVALSLRKPGERKGPKVADTVVDAWLKRAGFDRPVQAGRLYPHELSGGMAQRACIALALARGSRFLIADEPTTGLDPTVQRGILKQLRALRDGHIGILFITHDLRIVPDLADEVIVMHEGQVVDRLAADHLDEARSPHTRRLLVSTARIAGGLL